MINPGPSKLRAPKVVVVYEDFVTGQRAMKASKRLCEQSSRDLANQPTLWKFDLLRVPSLARMSAQDAAEADVIILAAHGDQELPAHITKWLNSWLDKKTERTATLVALLGRNDQDGMGGSPAHDHLRTSAERAGLAFLSHPFPSLPAHTHAKSPAENVVGIVADLSPGFEQDPAEASVPRWGINE